MALVLIVDDNAVNSKLARVTLAAAGFEVATAGDADQALAAIAVKKPALILMDIQLPGTDGLTLTRRLKDDPATSGIKIVALSAYAMKGDDEKAKAAGCDGYITKPIDTRAFAGQVAAYLGGDGKPRLLVIEDDASFGKLLRLRLSSGGFEVTLVTEIGAARAALAASRPHAILLDGRLRKPGDGLEFCKELKGAEATRAIPVVMLSGTDREGGTVGEPGGPDLSLTKSPEVLDVLAEKVRALLRP